MIDLNEFGFSPLLQNGSLADVYERPSNWLARPDISAMPQCVTFLLAIFPGSANTFTYQCGGANTFEVLNQGIPPVNVGTFTNYTATFDFNNINSPVVGLGYKMVWVCIKPQPSQNITTLLMGFFPTRVLDCQYKLPFGSFTIGTSSNMTRYPMWECLDLLAFNALPSIHAFSLGFKMQQITVGQSLPVSTTLTSGMMITGINKFDDLFSFDNVTTTANMFSNTLFLRDFKSSSFQNVQNCSTMFQFSNIRTFEANMSGVTNPTNMFIGTELEKCICLGLRYGISLNGCNMSANALNECMTSLGVAVASQTLDLRNNPGSLTCNASIATSKGFTVLTV